VPNSRQVALDTSRLIHYVSVHQIQTDYLMQAIGGGARNGILSLTIKDKAVLYAAYMPFVKNGGMFIPTGKSYKLGDEVFMLLSLMDEAEKIPVAGKVIWITPRGAQGNRAAGIGVQFTDQDNTAVTKIETYLAGSIDSDKPTHTM